jgi:hypothetical protein
MTAPKPTQTSYMVSRVNLLELTLYESLIIGTNVGRKGTLHVLPASIKIKLGHPSRSGARPKTT